MRLKFFPLLLFFAALLTGITVRAQDMGVEFASNGDGTYTLTWTGTGGIVNTITTNSAGVYDANNGSCSTCGTLPPAYVVGYTNSSSNFQPSFYQIGDIYYAIPSSYPVISSESYYVMYMQNPTYVPPDGYAPPVPVTNPCNMTTQDNGATASSSLKLPLFAAAAAGLNTTSSTENGFSFGFDTSPGTSQGHPMTVPGTDGTGTSLSVPTSATGMDIIGSAHTHPAGTLNSPDPGDIYALLKGYNSNPDYTVSYVYAADGTKWAIEVTDPQAAAAFYAAYPPATNLDVDSWASGSPLLGTFTTAQNDFAGEGASFGFSEADAETYSNAYVLSTYNTGIVMLQADADGNYHQIAAVTNGSAGLSFSKFTCP